MTTATPLQRDAMTETYHDVHDLICHTVHGFIRKNGRQWGTFDELFAQANWEFMVAFRDYQRPDGNRDGDSSFSTWCRWVVSKGLLEHQRNIIRRDRMCRITVRDTTEMEIPADVSEFRLIDLLDELTDDAALVAKLTLNPPKVLTQCIAEAKGSAARNVQAVLRQYLYGLDWEPDRVNAAFAEIADHIS